MLSSWNLAQSLQECLIVAHKPELRRHAQTQIFDRICSSCAKFPNMFNSCAQQQNYWETMIGVENTSQNYEFLYTFNTRTSPWVLRGSGPWHHVQGLSKVLAQDFIKLLILARIHLLAQTWSMSRWEGAVFWNVPLKVRIRRVLPQKNLHFPLGIVSTYVPPV